MITPTQCKAVIATLLALTLPSCAFQPPWASPPAVAMNQSLEGPLPPRNDVPASNQFPLAADEASITGSVEDEAMPDKRAKKPASCDRRQAVSIGMTRAQLYASCWGKPTSISASTIGIPGERQNLSELLVYQGFDYIFLEDGVVTSIQVSSR